MNYDRHSHCPCKNGPKCDYCSYCLGCSCRCHSWFTVHTRLCSREQEEKLLKRVEETANKSTGGADEEQMSLALDRLKHAKREIEPPPASEGALEQLKDAEGEVAPPAVSVDNPTQVAVEQAKNGDSRNGNLVPAQKPPTSETQERVQGQDAVLSTAEEPPAEEDESEEIVI